MLNTSFKYFKEQFKPLLCVLVISAVGFLLNLYPIPLFSNIHLILGNVAFVIIAMRFGVLYSLLSAMIVATAFVISFAHPFGYIIYGFEAVFIALLRKRGWYVLYADLLYWIVIGMPLTALVLNQLSDMPEQLFLLTITKQAFNGLVYTCLAGLIVYFFPKTFAFKYRQQPRVLRSFKAQLVYATTLIITFSIMATSIFVTHSVINSQHEILEKSIGEHKQYLKLSANRFIEKYEQVIENAANNLSLQHKDNAVQQHFLSEYHDLYPEFRTMFISNNEGNVTAMSPLTMLAQLKDQNKIPNVNFRKYFQVSIGTDDVYVSEAIEGKGFGQDTIVSISKSFYFQNEESKSGIVQGSLNLTKFERIIPDNLVNEISYVITGQNNHIIYASSKLNLDVKKPFNYQDKRDLTFKNTGLVELFNQNTEEHLDYFLTQDLLKNGWNIYVLLDSNKVINTVEREYLLIFNLLFLAFLISISLAQRIGEQITKPLNFIIKQLQSFEVDNGFIFRPLYSNSAKEIVILYDELQRNKNEINNYQNKLEKEVEQRTNELQVANEKLTQLAQKDGLTQIYNRRYFDEHFGLFQKMALRSNNNLAVVILDIDKFKKVNDIHGHLIGDECLKILASILMKEFSRSTDLIARYGGEEFILVINQISEKNLDYKLEKLRKTIASTIMYNQKHEGFKLTASFGAIIAPATFSEEVKDWIKVADLCLYKAKNSGRNNVKIESFLGLF
ncbi:diguanylate cyclase [Thalassotalea psychrophila]|uniref:diguanylate cyclase n=1 Tax=Thalassotalea psychrophila TaxID=3065647 RepID=A0ABY9TWI7_9GAMM|nr:diguanylate cyclase [Colwelliaceae bacterium SQ149]